MVKVRRMSRAKRILLMTFVLLMSVNALQASLWRRKEQKPAEAAPAATMALAAIEADGSRVVLRTSGAPAYTSYSPAPDVFVVDLTATGRPADLAIPAALPTAITSVTAEEAVEMGSRLTRVTFRMSQPSTLQASADGNSIVVTVPSALAPVDVPAVADTAARIEESPRVEPIVEAAPTAVEEPLPAAESLTSASRASMVRRVETTGDGDGLVVRIVGDGTFTYNAFRLENPSRLVVDLNGVKNSAAKKTLDVNGNSVRRVRVAQFKGAPDPVTRVVFDLAGKSQYHVNLDGNSLAVSFGTAPVATTAAVVEAPVTRPAKTEVLDIPVVEKAAVTPPPAPVNAARNVTDDVPVIAESAAPAWKMPAAASAGAKSVIRAQATQAPPRPSEDVFNEAATPAAVQAQAQAQATRTLSGSQRVFTGEPLDLSLKDADIKDVLRTFAQLTGLNIAVDPQVTGTVTVDFVDVPWDQALDLILRQNGLMYTLEGNVMRVGQIDRLTQEAAAAKKLADQDRLNVPLTTLSFKLSYARAADVASLLKDVASERARIIVDSRTNQLIISEIPQYLQTMRNLIDTVDIPNRQVVIEARIVETTKLFSRQWGFSWGFDGVLDPALGNGTGLVFPNRIGYTGGPFSFTGGAAPILGFSLTDVLGAFNLDFALHAAEAENLVRVVSAPRLTTQDNNSAEIQSGVQIPYQTRVNFTTTVTYIDATLRLSVLPQITEAGTVIMDIALQKTTPGDPIEGSAGTPLNTRQARTRLMVRDGGTAIIGGIYQSSDTTGQSRIPVLHQIPVLGNLFRSNSVRSTHDELLIFITPRIVRG
jgi:type IV pilus assembly protein PilQ